MQSLGQLGRVSKLEDSDCVTLNVNGREWTMNPSCVLPAPGEQPADEMSRGTSHYRVYVGLKKDIIQVPLVNKHLHVLINVHACTR